MKTTGNGFRYWVDEVEYKNFDDWEKKIKNLNVTTDVEGLNLKAKTVKDGVK